MLNPFNLDPSRTTDISRVWMKEAKERFDGLWKAIEDLIVTEDALGLKPIGVHFNGFAINNRWYFLTNPQKFEAFGNWLRAEIGSRILDKEGMGSAWTDKFVRAAYKKGVTRAYKELSSKRQQIARSNFLNSGVSAQVEMSLATAKRLDSAKILLDRSFGYLKNATDQMATDMGRVLATGVSRGLTPAEIAKTLKREFGIAFNRAMTIARTETVHAQAEGQLDGYEDQGITHVSVMAEWVTQEGACPQCSAMEGTVFTIAEARGLIPRHPNCKCAWRIVAVVRGKEPQQVRSRRGLMRAIASSVRAQNPKLSKSKAFDNYRLNPHSRRKLCWCFRAKGIKRS